MKNIERFNLLTAHIFGVLYASFPLARQLHEADVMKPVKALLGFGPEEETVPSKFFANTVMWLEETGYIYSRGSGQDRKIVLTPKAFEAMAAPLPKALRGKEVEASVPSVGEKLAEVATGAGKDIAKETWKQVSSQIVGQVIGHAAKVFSGP